jgi:2-methylisocitrate lyase-like PEP mutase family enzyme
MATETKAKREAFRALHDRGCFVLPNPWDVGSAVRLARMGFKALASTSAGFAWTLGREDGQVSRDELLAHLRALDQATDLPINADYEAGFADDPDGVARNVALVVAAGVAGLSIEDRTGSTLYPMETAIARMRAARAAIRNTGEDVVLVGRSEGFLIGNRDLSATIARLKAYSEAGADCLYAPGVTDPQAIKTIVDALAPKPVNVLLINSTMRVPELAALGVRRVSTGGGLAHAAWAGFDAAAHMLIEAGTVPDRK